ncbi:hypothetical protein [Thermodesulfitimonas sp.]
MGKVKRETLCLRHTVNFIADSINSYLRHASLKKRNDELSVGMIAFNEAVTRFQLERGYPF